jgi:beta-lactamase class D
LCFWEVKRIGWAINLIERIGLDDLLSNGWFIGLAYQEGKDIVFRFIIDYSSLMDFGP